MNDISITLSGQMVTFVKLLLDIKYLKFPSTPSFSPPLPLNIQEICAILVARDDHKMIQHLEIMWFTSNRAAGHPGLADFSGVCKSAA